MYLISLLEDLEAITLVHDFSPGGSESNHTCTCLLCWRIWKQLHMYLLLLLEDLEATIYVPALSATEASNIKSRLYSLLKEGG